MSFSRLFDIQWHQTRIEHYRDQQQQQRIQSHAPAFSVYLSLRIWQSENSLLRLFSPMLKGISSVHTHTPNKHTTGKKHVIIAA